MKKLKLVFKIVGNWRSVTSSEISKQYLYITYEGIYYLIYLKFVQDPWKCFLIKNPHDSKNLVSATSTRKEIKLNYYTEEELEHVKQNALSRINEYLKTIK